MSKRANRRTRTWVAVAGVVLTAAGVAGTLRGLQGASKRSTEMLHVSQSMIASGVTLIGLSILSSYRVTVDEAYKLGYDLGNEAGFQRGREVGKPVVVDLVPPDNKRKFR